ncbi:MAG TPA: HWE histidine kinase domain-containing protein [Steroidobacteraceae bacterium]
MTANESPDNAELKHRIRRVLSVIRSIAVHMSAHETDPRESALHLAGRVGAIGRVAVTPVSGGIDLESLVLDELRVHGVNRASIAVKGPAVRLNAKSAELMSLALHELATNAIKFGALSQSQTQLRVIWYFTGALNSRLRFEWAEYGVQLAPGARRNSGFGSDVVKRLIASELRGKGEMLFLDGGVLCTIEIPANEALLQNE